MKFLHFSLKLDSSKIEISLAIPLWLKQSPLFGVKSISKIVFSKFKTFSIDDPKGSSDTTTNITLVDHYYN